MSTCHDGHAVHHSLTALKLILALVLVCLFGAASLALADQPADANPPAQDQGAAPADDLDVAPLLGDPAPADDDTPEEPATGDITIQAIDEKNPDLSDGVVALLYLYDQDGNPATEKYILDDSSSGAIFERPTATHGSAIAIYSNRQAAIIRDVPAGYTYRITRQPSGSANPNMPGFDMLDLVRTSNAEGTVQAGETSEVLLFVERARASLEFSSTGSSGNIPVSDDEFSYRFTFIGPDGQPLTEKLHYSKGYAYQDDYETGLVDPTDLVVNLGMNHCRFWGMPVGTTYTIEEIDPPDGWTHNHENPQSGVINGYVSRYLEHRRTDQYSNIRISKYVTPGSDLNMMFDFKVTITLDGIELTDEFDYRYYTREPYSPGSSSYEYVQHYGKMRSGDTLSSVGLSILGYYRSSGSNALEILRLPPGAMVKIEEIVPDGWEFCNELYDIEGGLVREIGPLSGDRYYYRAVFANNQTSVRRGDLVLKKAYDAPSGVQRPTVTYDVYVWNESGAWINDAFRLETKNTRTGGTTVKRIESPWNYYYRIEVKEGYEYTFLDVPAGWTYEIVEPGTIEVPGGYYEQTSATNTMGAIQADATTEAYYTNRYREGDVPAEHEYSNLRHYLYSDVDGFSGYDVKSGTVSFRVRIFDEEGNESDEEFSYTVTGYGSHEDNFSFHSGDTITPVSPLNGNRVFQVIYKLPVGYSFEIEYLDTTDPMIKIVDGEYHEGVVKPQGEYDQAVYSFFASNKLIVMKDDDGGPYNGTFSFTVTFTDAEGKPYTDAFSLDYSSGDQYSSAFPYPDEKGQYTFELRGQDRVRFS